MRSPSPCLTISSPQPLLGEFMSYLSINVLTKDFLMLVQSSLTTMLLWASREMEVSLFLQSRLTLKPVS